MLINIYKYIKILTVFQPLSNNFTILFYLTLLKNRLIVEQRGRPLPLLQRGQGGHDNKWNTYIMDTRQTNFKNKLFYKNLEKLIKNYKILIFYNICKFLFIFRYFIDFCKLLLFFIIFVNFYCFYFLLLFLYFYLAILQIFVNFYLFLDIFRYFQIFLDIL